MTMTNTMTDLYRVCVKIYAIEPVGVVDDAEEYVPIFHEWIRDQRLDVVAVDVADYAHVPASPGIMLVGHEATFALDEADDRYGLLVQRRRPIDGDGVDAIATTMRQALQMVDLLEGEPRLTGKLRFDRSTIRIESNDRLRAPNTDEGYEFIEPLVRQALEVVFPGERTSGMRIQNDPRDRLAIEVRLEDRGERAA